MATPIEELQAQIDQLAQQLDQDLQGTRQRIESTKLKRAEFEVTRRGLETVYPTITDVTQKAVAERAIAEYRAMDQELAGAVTGLEQAYQGKLGTYKQKIADFAKAKMQGVLEPKSAKVESAYKDKLGNIDLPEGDKFKEKPKWEQELFFGQLIKDSVKYFNKLAKKFKGYSADEMMEEIVEDPRLTETYAAKFNQFDKAMQGLYSLGAQYAAHVGKYLKDSPFSRPSVKKLSNLFSARYSPTA